MALRSPVMNFWTLQHTLAFTITGSPPTGLKPMLRSRDSWETHEDINCCCWRKIMKTRAPQISKELQYRATPHQTTGASLAELLFGRPINIKLPALHNPVINDALLQSDSAKKEKMKQYSEQTKKRLTFWAPCRWFCTSSRKEKGKLKTPFSPKPYRVIKTSRLRL